MSRRKKYSPDYKLEAIDWLVVRGRVAGRLPGILALARSCLSAEFGWARETQPGGEKAFPGPGSLQGEELARLKRELVRVTKERDSLRGAAAHFAKESSSRTR